MLVVASSPLHTVSVPLLCRYHALRLAVSVAPFRCPFALLFMRCLRLWYLLSTRRVSYASSVPPCFYRSFVTPGALPISLFYFRREYACLLLKVADGCSATTSLPVTCVQISVFLLHSCVIILPEVRRPVFILNCTRLHAGSRFITCALDPLWDQEPSAGMSSRMRGPCIRLALSQRVHMPQPGLLRA